MAAPGFRNFVYPKGGLYQHPDFWSNLISSIELSLSPFYEVLICLQLELFGTIIWIVSHSPEEIFKAYLSLHTIHS